MTPAQLFAKFDTEGEGSVSIEDLTQHCQKLLRLEKPFNPALNLDNPLEMLDLNGDGEVSRDEFCGVLDQVMEARRDKFGGDDSHPIYRSAQTQFQAGKQAYRRIFGPRAFIECLLKIAMEHLTYHGTAEQAAMPTVAKATWLLMYMHWKFKCALKLMNSTDKIEESGLSPVARGSGQPLPKYISPWRRLLKYHPRLFLDFPENLQTAQPTKSAEPKSGCDSDAFNGMADVMLQKRLSDAAPVSSLYLLFDLVEGNP